jgi:streptogrisin C
VAYLRSRYGIGAAEAARRVALQQSSAALAQRLAATFPDTYGGMWLDQAGGGLLTVGATRPGPVRAAVEGAGFAVAGDAAHVRVVPVNRSVRDLRAAADRLATALGVEPGTDVVVDEPANGLVALAGPGTAVRADDARLAGALAIAGAPARVERRATAAVPKACDPLHCARSPMRGGIRLDVPRDDGTVGGCTTGFNVRSAATGELYMLTAGHCVVGGRHTRVDDTWHEYLGPKVPVTVEGVAGLAENAFPNDYAIMPYQAGAADFWTTGKYRPKRAVRMDLVNEWCPGGCGDSRDVAVTGVTPYPSIMVGWVVCATGAAYTPKLGETYVDSGAGAGYVPGTRCGELVGKSGGGIDVRICARPGDSGGPLFTEADGRALGILSHGDPGQGACTNPAERNSYAPVSTILDRANARTGNTLQLRLVTGGGVVVPMPPR